MTRRQILFLTGFLASAAFTGAVQAENKLAYKPSCTPVYEEIVPLRVPNFDQAAMWKKTVGVQGIDRPRALMRVADGGTIAVGESLSYDEKEGLKPARLQMIRQDKTGKVTVEAYNDVKNLDHVVDAVLKKTAVVVLSSLSGGDMVLTSLNGAGAKKDEKVLHDPKRNLMPMNFVALKAGGFIILAQGTGRNSKGEPYTALLWVDENGKITHVKEYMPGVKSLPWSVRKTDDGALLVAGRVETENGNDAGWLIKAGTDGELIFQRPYQRGADATLRYAAATKDGGVIAIGDAIPAGEGDKAAWVLKTDASGNVVWQKYLTGKYSYAAVDLDVMEDGRIETVWAASPTSFGGRKFARAVTLTNEGYLLGDESFLEGSNAIPFRVIQTGDKRVMLGMAETGFSQEKREDELQYVTYDTWIMGMPELPAFKNPCASAGEKKLDDLP
ncbi:MAG TPA: hypothetical protein PKI93_02160 [Alphaproteobacteria bacterium]|nr:hypothetical protein [Alphaproteobacteria bacterium]HNS44122.1 hypothetical protein [Alphaproteobacteria bacterium]